MIQSRLPYVIVTCIAWLFLQTTSATPRCKTWLGKPDFGSCRQLLFGQRDRRTQTIETRGIEIIDRKDYLFHTWVEYLQVRPSGVSSRQFLNRVGLPQPQYSRSWIDTHPPGSVPSPSYSGPVPWSNGKFYSCNNTELVTDKAAAVCA